MPKLLNFNLVMDHEFAIAVEAFGIQWDLHNLCSLHEFSMDVERHRVALTWRLDRGDTAQFPATVFRMIFSDTTYLEVSPRDPAMPVDEDINLDTVSFIGADEDLHWYTKTDSIPCFDPLQNEGGDHHMVFRFCGGQVIRIGSKTAEFDLVA